MMMADAPEQTAWGLALLNAPAPAQNAMAANHLAQQGRGTDSMIAHLTPGEHMVPPEVLERYPELGAAIRTALSQMGQNPNEFVIGHPDQKINPITGQPEFGLGKSFKKAFKSVKKIVGKVMSNPITAGIATVATAGALAPLMPAALGTGTLLGTAASTAAASGGLNLLGGASLGEALTSGLASGATAGLTSGAGSLLGGATPGIAGGLPGAASQGATSGLGGATLGSLMDSSGLTGTLNNAGWGSTLFNAMSGEGGIGSQMLGGLLNVSVGDLAQGALSGLGANPNIGLSSEVPETVQQGTSGGTALNPQTGQVITNAGQGSDATGSNQGAGAVPYSPNAVDTLAQAGVSFVNPIANRDTGMIDFSASPFSNAMRNVRRGTWGGSLLSV